MGIVIPSLNGNNLDNADSESLATETGKRKREMCTTRSEGIPLSKASGVGIRHFLTNRIRIAHQQVYMDKWHCVFVIPVLTVEQVRKWNGSSYDAIVLAGKFIYNDAATVYKYIGASGGNIAFVDEDECKAACTLLRTMILCTCKASKSTFTETFLTTNESSTKLYAPTGGESAVYIKCDQTTVPVPECRDWNRKYRVRKITFSASHNVNKNPAPDPVLLLGKATSTSNWLKCQGLFLLPSYDNADDSDSSCSTSDSVVSYREEMALRGLSFDILERSQHVGSVVEVSCHSSDTDDESLSDDDE